MTARLRCWALGIWLVAAVPALAHAACDNAAAADATTFAQAARIGAALPLTYVGTFQWDGSSDLQHVTVSFSGCVVEGSVRLVGRGAYLDSGTEIDVIADVQGDAIILLERNPVGGSGLFLTEGRHRGELAPDLSRICAVWVTYRDGSTGRLRLGRTPEDAKRCMVPPLS